MTLYRRSKELGHVVRSINEDGGLFCVDIFKRDDGSFGFEEYRNDPESGEGWYPVGFYLDQKFESEAEVLSAAKHSVAWLT